MMKKNIALIFAAVLLLSSCVHQFPESVPAQVDLRLTFNTDMPYFQTRLFPDETSVIPKSSPYDDALFAPDYSENHAYDLRYIVEAYRQTGSGSYSSEAAKRWVFSDEDATLMDDYSFSIELDEGNYILRAWADFVPEGSSADYIYNTEDWSYGIYYDYRKYVGNSDLRDVYVGSLEIEVIRYGSQVAPVSGVIEMNRPHGKYIFLTTDLDEFIVKVTKFQNSGKSDDGTKAPEFDINDYKFIVTYSSYIPQRYSIQYDRAVDSAPTATYEASIIQLDESRAIMGFDYIITGTTGETFAPMRLQLKDKEGTILAEHTNVNVPVKGNHYTIVEGRFLMQESSGGVAIDPGFNGPDIVVPI